MVFTFRNICLTLKKAQFCKATFYILESIQDNFPTSERETNLAVHRFPAGFGTWDSAGVGRKCDSTTAQNDHSLYSSIDGSNSRSIRRFSLCWPQHEWKPGAPPGSDVSASGRVHVMGQTDNSILNNFPYLLHIPIDWNWHTRKTIISLKR